MKFQIITLFLAVSCAYALVIKRAITAAQALWDVDTSLKKLEGTLSQNGNLQAIFDDAKNAIETIKTGIKTAENSRTIGHDEAESIKEPIEQIINAIFAISNFLRRDVQVVEHSKQCNVARNIFNSMMESFGALYSTITSKSTDDVKAVFKDDLKAIDDIFTSITFKYSEEHSNTTEL
ncbi:hypothetical protein BGZ94_005515 [Podila epigama]|nr:hypothetical protein BGZ94_005515 [Podila epigama]